MVHFRRRRISLKFVHERQPLRAKAPRAEFWRIFPESEILAKFFPDMGERCGENLAKVLAESRPSFFLGHKKFRNKKSGHRGSFGPDIPADIRPKTSVRPSKSWKNKHLARTSCGVGFPFVRCCFATTSGRNMQNHLLTTFPSFLWNKNQFSPEFSLY